MRIFVPALLAFMLFLSSCQQELDEILDDVDPPVATDSTRLTMYVELDTTLAAGQDTLYKLIFRYDNQQRLIAADYTDRYFFPDIETGTTEYFYDANDKGAYKYVDVFHDAIATYRDTVFLSYTDGYISRDSVIEYNITTNQFQNTDVNYFTKTGNNVIVTKKRYNSPGVTLPDNERTGTLLMTYLNGNIISQEDTGSFEVNFDRPHHTAGYDNKKNPFWDIDLRYPVLGRTLTSQKNNVIEERRWDVPGGSFDQSWFYSYTYRPDGYPASSIFGEPGNSFLSKAVYIYNR